MGFIGLLVGYTSECGGSNASPGVGISVSTLTGTLVLLVDTQGCCTLGADGSSEGTSVSLSVLLSLLRTVRSTLSRWVCLDVTCHCGPAVSCLSLSPETVLG